jgi:hypothetical protein
MPRPHDAYGWMPLINVIEDVSQLEQRLETVIDSFQHQNLWPKDRIEAASQKVKPISGSNLPLSFVSAVRSVSVAGMA